MSETKVRYCFQYPYGTWSHTFSRSGKILLRELTTFLVCLLDASPLKHEGISLVRPYLAETPFFAVERKTGDETLKDPPKPPEEGETGRLKVRSDSETLWAEYYFCKEEVASKRRRWRGFWRSSLGTLINQWGDPEDPRFPFSRRGCRSQIFLQKSLANELCSGKDEDHLVWMLRRMMENDQIPILHELLGEPEEFKKSGKANLARDLKENAATLQKQADEINRAYGVITADD